MVRVVNTNVMDSHSVIKVALHDHVVDQEIHVIEGRVESLAWILKSEDSHWGEGYKSSFLELQDSRAIADSTFWENDHWRELLTLLDVMNSGLDQIDNGVFGGTVFTVNEDCLSASSDPADDWPAFDTAHC